MSKHENFYDYIASTGKEPVEVDEHTVRQLRQRMTFDDFLMYIVWTVCVVGTLYFGAHLLAYLVG